MRPSLSASGRPRAEAAIFTFSRGWAKIAKHAGALYRPFEGRLWVAAGIGSDELLQVFPQRRVLLRQLLAAATRLARALRGKRLALIKFAHASLNGFVVES